MRTHALWRLYRCLIECQPATASGPEFVTIWLLYSRVCDEIMSER